jgi:hypothetical protein
MSELVDEKTVGMLSGYVFEQRQYLRITTIGGLAAYRMRQIVDSISRRPPQMRRAPQSLCLGVMLGILIHHLQATREELVRIERYRLIVVLSNGSGKACDCLLIFRVLVY